jgi:magnesium chelatase family protein
MLARRLTTIVPAMTLSEALDTNRIHSIAGRNGGRVAVVTPRSLHHARCDSIPLSPGNGSDS